MESDKVAVRYYLSAPKTVHIGEDTYNFVNKANVSIAWVKREHVDTVLAMKKSCCSGQRKTQFRLADVTHIRRWKAGGGR